MGKKISVLTAIMFVLFLLPVQVLGAGGGSEEAASSEPSGMLVLALTIMSILTLVTMIFYSFRDNG
ncbi:hypothetical protein [Halalkalibacter alkaliphilus]|uniref:Uncharacterized protein n=1 Tax=Halalkalibacter alkaliphilus TaxID=2917993 RepID=A0A9X2CMV2_9BACI|nr:hypothetical protein [Halalkalibacter alkaliphilus]MCL7745963.1 hypothetical protein [Halalkalibacter alkaliphilus]